MASIRSRKDNNLLFFDFRYRGIRCREQTALPDTHQDRARLQKILRKIESEISNQTFSYRRYFPNSKLLSKFELDSNITVGAVNAVASRELSGPTATTPTFAEFAEVWIGQMSVEWRKSYKATVRQILDQHLIPVFGSISVSSIRRDDILTFRSQLAKVDGRKEGSTLSPRRINAITLVLRQVLNEAADRFEFTTPSQRIKPLKLKRNDVQPFSLDEVKLILSTVREDFRNYLTVRFFTGLRTGELDGLQWKYVDFDRRLILVRETIVHGEVEYTKTDGSQRDIRMSQIVFDALKQQYPATHPISSYVFCTTAGNPIDANNFCKRVWYPLLRHLGLAKRRPYQSRHTAATLWLAAGENPQWISQQLGHASSEMLFKVYARFVPNLTRQDGSAFERLLLQSGATPANQSNSTPPDQPAEELIHE